MSDRHIPLSLRLLAFGLAAACLQAGAQTDDAQKLLAATDAIRNPPGSFSMDVKLIEYRSGELSDSSSLVTYARPDGSSGRYNNLIRFMAPVQDSGKLVLRNGSDMWFFDPGSKATVRITAQARLTGQASNGDVMSSNLAVDYAAESLRAEPVQDDAGTERAAMRLRLKAQRPDVAYAVVDYWVDAASRRPIKAQFRTAEGRLLKSAFYRRYRSELGLERPTETVIVDGLDPQWVTVMRTSNYQQRDVPPSWLQRDYLPRFTGDER